MLYTRRGDDGTTKTFGTQQRISKSSEFAEAIGTLDEINSYLGLCKVEAEKWNYSLAVDEEKKSLGLIVHEIQENLFIIQAELAGADKRVGADKITIVEKYIDTIESVLPPIHTFFISGGMELASRFDVARTIARRAERTLVRFDKNSKKKMSEEAKKYMNRLSSLLYALARYSNFVYGSLEKAPRYK